jgi:hypothetical protein
MAQLRHRRWWYRWRAEPLSTHRPTCDSVWQSRGVLPCSVIPSRVSWRLRVRGCRALLRDVVYPQRSARTQKHPGVVATKVGYFGVKSTNVHRVQMRDGHKTLLRSVTCRVACGLASTLLKYVGSGQRRPPPPPPPRSLLRGRTKVAKVGPLLKSDTHPYVYDLTTTPGAQKSTEVRAAQTSRLTQSQTHDATPAPGARAAAPPAQCPVIVNTRHAPRARRPPA